MVCAFRDCLTQGCGPFWGTHVLYGKHLLLVHWVSSERDILASQLLVSVEAVFGPDWDLFPLCLAPHVAFLPHVAIQESSSTSILLTKF